MKISRKNGELCSKHFRNSVKDLLTNHKCLLELEEDQQESFNRMLLRRRNRIKLVNCKNKLLINKNKNFQKNPILKMMNKKIYKCHKIKMIKETTK